MAYLELISGRAFGRVYRLDRPRLKLGRNPDLCDLSEPFVGDRNVSRVHAEIERQVEDYYLSDLNSRNGTWLNGKKLAAPDQLGDGDRIRICAYEFRFHTQDLSTRSDSDVTLPGQETRLVELEGDSSRVEATSDAPVSTTPVLPAEIGRGEEKLRAVLQMLTRIGSAIRLEEVARNLLEGLLNVFPQADRTVIRIMREDGSVAIEAVRHRYADREGPVPISRRIMETVIGSKRSVLSSDLEIDPRFRASDSVHAMGMRSVMCAPLLDVQSNVLGIIHADVEREGVRFGAADLELLTSVTPQVAVAIRYAQLHQQQVEQDRINRDLELARRVQQELLPKREPQIDQYSFFSFYRPAFHLGGDYYDYVPLADNRLAIVVADVAGKGISAALLAAKLSGELKHYLAGEVSPATVMGRLNRSLHQSTTAEHFVTQVLMILHPASHRLAIANAGHWAPLLRCSDGTVEHAGEEATGLALGVDPDETYRQAELTLEPGDSLTVFTDGFIDAQRVDGERYGLGRLTGALRAATNTPTHIGQSILEDVDRFAQRRAPNDDRCLVCLQRSAAAQPS